MNKQELIDELKRISLEKQHKALTHPESKNYYEGMVMAYSQVVHMVNTVLKLDEPKKPVVPGFVAELLDYYRQSPDVDLLVLLLSFHDWYYSESKNGKYEEAIDWLVKHPEIYMRAWLYGYEVEKEQLYRVIMPNPQSKNGNVLVLRRTQQGTITVNKVKKITARLGEGMDLTEEEIKSVDERYWPFAVPVEEVVEG
ncbi:phage protein, putative [Enterococcus faecium]|uniref:DUF1642 domain-containing protein n=1 Tax=Enterococcus faecium TaxID=1352 RepID=UPI00102569FD|nr:DUF1642 domain-containing protein [Enterococcus faecium]VFA76786.1 phage protein, putative [Enterococcus faecium]